MKLGVIVPYRNRESHLSKFTDETTAYLKSKKIDFEIVVVEQSDDKPFNRGKLLNIGYLKAKSLGCDYVVFHDVDMIPIEVDYSFSEIPLHLATNFELEYEKSKNLQFDDYFGGVTMLSNSIFEKINGYSNDYWGWGAEDDDVLYRCAIMEIPTYRKDCKYKSLDHVRNIEQVPYMKNVHRFQDFQRNPTIQAIMADGISTLSYKKIEDKKLSEHSRMITVTL